MRQSTTGDVHGDSYTETINLLVEKVNSSFDGFNRLKEIEKIKAGERVTVSFNYNGDGLRTKKISKSSKEDYQSVHTNYHYDRQHVILETNETGKEKARYIRGNNYIGRYDSSNQLIYYLYNGHGDVVQTITQEGEVQNQYDYDIFGNPTLQVEVHENAIRYAGEFYDAETGLYYLRARYYNPYTGRFNSEDSYWGEDTIPLSLNRYTYGHNDPIRYVDPSGHAVTEWDKKNLGFEQLQKIDRITKKWLEADERGDEKSKKALHKEAEAIRNTKRASDEVGTGDGKTVKDRRRETDDRDSKTNAIGSSGRTQEERSTNRERSESQDLNSMIGGLIGRSIVTNLTKTIMTNPIIAAGSILNKAYHTMNGKGGGTDADMMIVESITQGQGSGIKDLGIHLAMMPQNEFDWLGVIPADSKGNRQTAVEKLLKYVDRDDWGAESLIPKEDTNYIEEDLADYYYAIAIHHSDRSPSEDIQDLQEYFQDKGWADIGYHFVIGADGTIYEGREIDVQGSHVGGNNTGKIGIVLQGNFNKGSLLENIKNLIQSAPYGEPTDAQIESLKSLIDALDSDYGIDYVGGHRDFGSSDCPGNIAYPILIDEGIIDMEGYTK